MNKSQRIKIDVDATNVDKYLMAQLEQEVDTLEFLSMSIDTKDVYQDFNADYGVLVGRVTANGGVGIQNAKISIFIPLTDEDASDSQISSLYPYKSPSDKNNEGKRYNLLPRVAKTDPTTKVTSPKQPFGSFPIKEETVTNASFLNVYKKYYKYTALTNKAGDYMIFGVPIGVQTVHLSVDITDIGEFSMTPASMVTNLGYSANLFTDNNSKIKPSTDLSDLPNIETQEVAVDIIPFWGDTTNFTIGVTRQDFRIRSVIDNSFVIFGTAFTDGDNAMWGARGSNNVKEVRDLFRARPDANVTIGMASKRTGKVTEKIYYYPSSITDDKIATADPIKDMLILDSSEYSVYKRDGDFVFIISCNRNKVVTDEFGNKKSVDDSSPIGVYTEFRGFITLEISPDEVPMNFTGDMDDSSTIVPFRYKLKFPQYASRNHSFTWEDAKSLGTQTNPKADTEAWRKQHMKFTGGKIYSVAKFHGLTYNTESTDANQFFESSEVNEVFARKTTINRAKGLDSFWNVGIINNSDYQDEYENSIYGFPTNSKDYYNLNVFGANWMNLCVYLPQLGNCTAGFSRIRYVRAADNFHKIGDGKQGTDNDNWYKKINPYYVNNNDQAIAAGDVNTKFLARSDLNWTDIIEISKADILKMNGTTKKGFTNQDIIEGLQSTTYRNGVKVPTGWSAACPINGGKKEALPTNAADPLIYFYKGFGTSNCIEFIISLGLI